MLWRDSNILINSPALRKISIISHSGHSPAILRPTDCIEVDNKPKLNSFPQKSLKAVAFKHIQQLGHVQYFLIVGIWRVKNKPSIGDQVFTESKFSFYSFLQ